MVPREWKAPDHDVRDFFNKGVTLNNSFDITGNNDNSNFRLAFTNLDIKGYMPDSNITRNTVSFNASTKIDRLTPFASFNYVISKAKGRPSTGYDDNKKAFQIETISNPAYTPQSEIYADLIKELTEASDMIVLNQDVFTSGDILYGGNAVSWKKFANSLKMRVALRMSKVPGSNYKQYIQEAVQAGVFTSNNDNATFKYIGTTPNNAPMYGHYVIGRNDFTLAKPFVDLLKGVNDTLNNKINPFEGLMDPRFDLWVNYDNYLPNKPDITLHNIVDIPYGMTDAGAQAFRRANTTPNFLASPTIFNAPDNDPVYMDYAEVCFILSEINGWDQEWYKKSVNASIEQWEIQVSELEEWGEEEKDAFLQVKENYLQNLPPANQETVLTQKYIALFLQPYQAWAEYRRTGFPKMLIKPGEVTYRSNGNDIIFNALIGNDIPSRLTYPPIETTVNGANYNSAVSRIVGDRFSTKLWWDVD